MNKEGFIHSYIDLPMSIIVQGNIDIPISNAETIPILMKLKIQSKRQQEIIEYSKKKKKKAECTGE